MTRTRLNKSPVSKLLTFTRDINYYDCENFILESASNRFDGMAHWYAHVTHIQIKASGYKDIYYVGEKFNYMKEIVINSLALSGFSNQSEELKSVSIEENFNELIIRQYTEESNLYRTVNELLRNGHSGVDIGGHDLVPWILQLNTAIRNINEFIGPSYRGTVMNSSDIQEYEVGKIFVWSAFTSFSKSESNCLGGNVLFEMNPVSGIAQRDKRAPRDISSLSYFPNEEEVLMPICGAYRITNVEKEAQNFIRVQCEILDHN